MRYGDMVTKWSSGPHQGSGAPRRIGEACKGGWLGDASIADQGVASVVETSHIPNGPM